MCVLVCVVVWVEVEYIYVDRRLSVTNLSSKNNFADGSTECSSHHQGESERSTKKRCYL